MNAYEYNTMVNRYEGKLALFKTWEPYRTGKNREYIKTLARKVEKLRARLKLGAG
jgi:hypothetical protein